MRSGKILAIFGLIVSTLVVFVKIMTPTNVQFVIDGSFIEFRNIPEIYDSFDVFLIGISCFVLGSSLVYLWLIGKNGVASTGALLKRSWDELLERLPNTDEKRSVSLIIDEGGIIFQSQLVDRSGYSKSKVSLILDRLEAKKILERKRRGMSKVIILK